MADAAVALTLAEVTPARFILDGVRAFFPVDL
jgi:hypothetical protein